MRAGRARERWPEAVLLTAAAIGATVLVHVNAAHWAYVPFVVMPWVALRLGTSAVAAIGALIAGVAAQQVSLAPTLWNDIDVIPSTGVVYVQVAIALLTATSLLLAAEAGERDDAVRERARADEVHRYEHDVAVSLQRALLPRQLVADRDVALAATYRPSDQRLEVGGDWYETLALPGDRIGVAVGDVVGHGLEAAAAMGQLRTAVAALGPDCASPVDLLDQLDEFAQRSPGCSSPPPASRRWTRARASCATPPRGTPRCSSSTRAAGPASSRTAARGRCARPRDARGDGTPVLAPGATLLFYSDGLVERRGEGIDDGLERLALVARRLRTLDVDALCTRIVAELLGDRPLEDDVVVVALRLQPASPYSTRNVASDVSRATIAPPRSRASRR